MKKLLFCLGLISLSSFGDVLPPPPATPAEVGAGLVKNKYISPYTLSQAGIGSPTNGITALQAEAIARGSGASGTNSFAGDGLGLTNLSTAPFWTNLVGLTPQNMNLDRLKTLPSLISSNRPIRLLFYGDDSVHTDLGIYRALTNWQRFNGSASANASAVGNGTLWYVATSSGLTYKAPAGGVDQLWPGPAMFVAPNGAGTNGSAAGLQGVRTTEIKLMGWQGNGHGTISIFTNAYGSTPTFFRAVPMDNGGALTPFVTNFSIGLVTNLVCSFTNAGGTNILVSGIGQRDTNLFGGFTLDLWAGSGVSIPDMFRNALSSNSFRVFLNEFDMAVITDLGNIDVSDSGSISDVPGTTNLIGVITNNNLSLDVVLTTTWSGTNAGTWFPTGDSWTNRQRFIEAGRIFGFAILDTWPLLTPLKRSAELGFINDLAHLTDAGDEYIGNFSASSLNLQWEQNRSYTNTTLAGQFSTAGKANLVGGNSFTGTQNHTGLQNITGSGYISIAGSFPQVNFVGADSFIVPAGREASRNDILFSLRSSGASYARPLYLSQTGAVTYLTSDAVYTDFRIGNSAWSYTGNGYGVTNVASLRMTTNSVAVTPNISLYITNADGVVYRLSAEKL